jgi:acetyl esterase
MSTRHLVDPQLVLMIDAAPTRAFTLDNLAQVRAEAETRFEMFPEPQIAGVAHMAKGPEGAPDVGVLVFTPPGDKLRPAIVHIHGGGMVLGSAYSFRRGPAAMALAADAVVISVDYRLAPETPFPGPQEDCYAALAWVFANAGLLNIDPARLIIMGESAGGGLAASLAHVVRDRGAFALSGQVLTYPMLDHRTGSADCPYKNPTTGEFIWTRALNGFGWTCLQGDYALDDDRIAWFSPSRAADLAGLAPTVILTGTLDLFFDENLDYARRLCAAGVPVELHSYAGAIHGFNIFAHAEVTQTFNRDLINAVTRLVA